MGKGKAKKGSKKSFVSFDQTKTDTGKEKHARTSDKKNADLTSSEHGLKTLHLEDTASKNSPEQGEVEADKNVVNNEQFVGENPSLGEKPNDSSVVTTQVQKSVGIRQNHRNQEKENITNQDFPHQRTGIEESIEMPHEKFYPKANRVNYGRKDDSRRDPVDPSGDKNFNKLKGCERRLENTNNKYGRQISGYQEQPVVLGEPSSSRRIDDSQSQSNSEDWQSHSPHHTRIFRGSNQTHNHDRRNDNSGNKNRDKNYSSSQSGSSNQTYRQFPDNTEPGFDQKFGHRSDHSRYQNSKSSNISNIPQKQNNAWAKKPFSSVAAPKNLLNFTEPVSPNLDRPQDQSTAYSDTAIDLKNQATKSSRGNVQQQNNARFKTSPSHVIAQRNDNSFYEPAEANLNQSWNKSKVSSNALVDQQNDSWDDSCSQATNHSRDNIQQQSNTLFKTSGSHVNAQQNNNSFSEPPDPNLRQSWDKGRVSSSALVDQQNDSWDNTTLDSNQHVDPNESSTSWDEGSVPSAESAGAYTSLNVNAVSFVPSGKNISGDVNTELLVQGGQKILKEELCEPVMPSTNNNTLENWLINKPKSESNRNKDRQNTDNWRDKNHRSSSRDRESNENVSDVSNKKYAAYNKRRDSRDFTDKEYQEYKKEFERNPDFKNVKEVNQDLFAISKEYSLAHCVAEDLRMGSGIAVQFKREFKELGNLLQQRPRQGGLALLHDEKNHRYIYYLVTKRDSTGKPTYENMWKSLQKLRDHIRDNKVTKLAIPRLGCGLDRLEWSDIKAFIAFLFRKVDVEIMVCNFQQNYGQTKKKLQTKSETAKTKDTKKSASKSKSRKKK